MVVNSVLPMAAVSNASTLVAPREPCEVGYVLLMAVIDAISLAVTMESGVVNYVLLMAGVSDAITPAVTREPREVGYVLLTAGGKRREGRYPHCTK